MSELWTAREAVAATGGLSTCDWTATGVSIDTRTLQPGDLFVALKDVRDGHDFVAQALEKGAAAALVARVPEGVDETAPLLIVDEVLPALEDLGRAGRARTGAKVVAITGSVGKTSTKEMMRAALEGQGRTHAAEASYNNHWGVPLTLARMPRDTEFAVIEIGMNHPGEISPLAVMARPHVALITTIAAAHLEAFENIEGIAHEKAAIFDGLEPGGTAVINADVGTADILFEAARAKAETVVRFGMSAGAEMRLTDVTVHDAATVGKAEAGGEEILFKVGTPGRHFALNALAVIAAAQAMGADRDVVVCDLGLWRPYKGRGTRETLMLDAVDERMSIELIDDAFNANPTSMAAALEVLAAARVRNDIGRVAAGRRIAILGDMLELGPDEARMHREVADLPFVKDIQVIHCVGPRMKTLYDALPGAQRGRWVESAGELAAEVHRLVDAGDVILVKGSKGSYVSEVVTALRRLAQAVAEKEDV
ncbi:UDP-N-acetylmuramoyl-tripeptide--D-alanyl-D-alanine ligase [Roseovarius atlanticus]|uniref:UDP-N-acetylmuramoyl-tripeptide--D-alanyl-D- alanine ligase n=1 Tax=Roseovarius atlanticus TaxID=1641875 RepID=UPI001C942290|nr:UDP-N-acetylmuramoyl-tripeptide--D-alanyl-D-alanine ligase [Roseovarius atlanticus]MBY5989264.1 UDP-N-acetylmuramoyl-tripeptide--D-alanyl-D-alanine ligase [Roseovarius atlanticus]MBY6124656.1 UDP-N-acetylmuramoyl-tripeptide--D-alanyl-D-alanine ligase [Roseovarius atlanticus]MBY6149151.1 UDP-N-acetylmuramoyl-tripeptide--D-alanyl-D-alanine ligase [Roseovarius atlanticus]